MTRKERTRDQVGLMSNIGDACATLGYTILGEMFNKTERWPSG